LVTGPRWEPDTKAGWPRLTAGRNCAKFQSLCQFTEWVNPKAPALGPDSRKPRAASNQTDLRERDRRAGRSHTAGRGVLSFRRCRLVLELPGSRVLLLVMTSIRVQFLSEHNCCETYHTYKAKWCLYLPPAFTLTSAFCAHGVFTRFLRFSARRKFFLQTTLTGLRI
jgi:hypothetical protein